MKVPSLRRLLTKSGSSSKKKFTASSTEDTCTAGSSSKSFQSSTRDSTTSSSCRDSTGSSGGEGQQQQQQYLLDRLGGMLVLNAIVMDFMNRVGSDKQLMRFFEGVDFRILSAHQKRYFAMAFTKVPEGVSIPDYIKRKHRHLFGHGLNETHFDLVAQHLQEALKARGFNDSIIVEAISVVAPLRSIFEEGAAEAAAVVAVAREAAAAEATVAAAAARSSADSDKEQPRRGAVLLVPSLPVH